MTTHYEEIRTAIDTFGKGSEITCNMVLERIDKSRWPDQHCIQSVIARKHLNKLEREGYIIRISNGMNTPKNTVRWRVA